MLIKTLVIAAALLGFVAAASPSRAGELDDVLARAMEGSKVPAMGILLIQEGKVAGLAVRGVRRMDGADPVRADDPWHIGSDGKAMTVAMVARLVEQGKLSWTTPLSKMTPELAASMQAQYRDVTLVQLLSHHAGLPHDIVDEKVLQGFLTGASGGTLTEQRKAYIARALQDAPVGPTSAFNYSNTGLLIAAVVAERATGKPYEQLMREEVFAPLGMSHVGFGLTQAGQPQGHLQGRLQTPGEGNPPFFAPAGNMYMPLADWARFCIDQLEGEAGRGRLLKPETYRLTHTAQPGGGGMGWGVQETIAGRPGPVLAHAGSDGSWMAIVALFPTRGTGVLITANAGEEMGGDAVDKAAFKQVLDRLSPPVAPAPAKPN